jgi:hypothetical protein
MPGLRLLTRIKQPVDVDDEVTHMGVINGLLRLAFPDGMGSRVVRKYSHDLDLIEILESDVFKIEQFTSDNEMKQLLWRSVGHGSLPKANVGT